MENSKMSSSHKIKEDLDGVTCKIIHVITISYVWGSY